MPLTTISSEFSNAVPTLAVPKVATVSPVVTVVATSTPVVVPTFPLTVVAPVESCKIDIHSLRLFDLAIVDVLGTVLGAYLIVRFFPTKALSQTNYFVAVLVALFAAGIVLHRHFKVRTTIDKLLFPNAK